MSLQIKVLTCPVEGKKGQKGGKGENFNDEGINYSKDWVSG